MEVVRRAWAEDFLVDTLQYRARQPLRTNVLGSVAVTVASGQRTYRETWFWLVLEGRDVIGAALRTAPFALHLGPMSDDAAAALARVVAEHDDGFPSLTGTSGAVKAFLESYRRHGSPGSARRDHPGRREHLYALDELRAPAVAGSWRLATIDDHALARRWFLAFLEFIDGPLTGAARYDDDALRVRLRAGALSLWSVDGEAVSMAGHAAPVHTPAGQVVRIGPVFTPEVHRGHGYASAVTAALSSHLLDQGATVMLHADADNPTSNAIYQRLGFVRHDSLTTLTLDTPT